MAHGKFAYRGLAGEASLSYIDPISLPTIIIIGIYFVICALTLDAITQGQSVAGFNTLLLILLGGLPLGKIALAASRGDTAAGFLSSQSEFAEAGSFALRYLVVCLLWNGGLYVLAYASGRGFAGLFSLPLSVSVLQTGVSAGLVVSFLMFFLALLGPFVSSLIAIATASVGEIFTPAPWLWVFGKRRGDLILMVVLGVGSGISFFAIYFLPIAFIALLLGSISAKLLLVAAGLVILIPGASIPVIVGRLTGAFILSENYDPRLEESGSLLLPHEIKAGMARAVVEEEAPRPVIENSAAEQSEDEIVALKADPADEFIAWLRQTLQNFPMIEVIYVFEYSSGAIHLGVELHPDTKLNESTKCIKSLNQLLGSAPSAPQSCKARLLDQKLTERVKALGLKIYQKS